MKTEYYAHRHDAFLNHKGKNLVLIRKIWAEIELMAKALNRQGLIF